MPLTQQEYHEYMTVVTQIRDLYTGMDGELKRFQAVTSESEEKRQRMETTLQRLEAEIARPQSPPPSADTSYKERGHVKAFFKAMYKGYNSLNADERKLVQTANALDAPPIPEEKAVFATGLSVGEDTTGGLFAPPEFVAEIIKNLVLYSPMRPYCKTRTTANRSVQFPKRTSTLAAAQWVGERTVRTDSTGWQLGRLEVPTNEMYSLVLITEQDLEDSEFDLEAELRAEISEQFGVAEGKAFLSGDATIQPQGILTHPAIPVKKSGSAGLPTPDTLISMVYDLPSVYAARAQFYMQRQTVGLVRQLKYTGGEQSYIWQPGAGPSQGGLDRAPNTIMGLPYVEVPDMPAAATSSNSILFGDLSRAYVIVQRVGMTFKRLSERWVENSQIGIYARQRVGGQVLLPEALRLYQLGT